jgi:hypothetical protein
VNRPISHSTVAHPNIGNANTDGLNGVYDVIVAKKETFITPDGLKGRARVFSRVTPEQIREDPSGELRSGAKKAKSFLTEAISKLKVPDQKKQRLRDMMTAQVKGNIQSSSKEFFGVDGFQILDKATLHLSVQKQVRFVDANNSQIPTKQLAAPTLPKEVILPELPPE